MIACVLELGENLAALLVVPLLAISFGLMVRIGG